MFIISGLALGIVYYYGLKSPPTEIETIVTTESIQVLRPGVPRRLKIPKISLEAVINPVGLTPQGDLDAPKILAETGWYKDGVRPGETGSAVIDGHFAGTGGESAAFDHIHKLQKGDELVIEDENGTMITFVMSGSRLYAPDEDAKAVFYSDDGKSRLNLITCQGAWVKSQQSYTTRLVVFFDKAP